MTHILAATVNDITERIIGAAIEVHRALGPGLLESAYQACLALELTRAGLNFRSQLVLPISYRDVKIDGAYRIDFLVEDCVIVEVKSVERLAPIHTAQIRTYLKLKNCPTGLLLNFNMPSLRQGLRRVDNKAFDRETRSEVANVK